MGLRRVLSYKNLPQDIPNPGFEHSPFMPGAFLRKVLLNDCLGFSHEVLGFPHIDKTPGYDVRPRQERALAFFQSQHYYEDAV